MVLMDLTCLGKLSISFLGAANIGLIKKYGLVGRVYMNFIIVSNRSGRHHSFNANLMVISGLVLAVLAFAIFIGFFTYRYLNYDSSISSELVVKWKHEMEVQRRYVERLKQDAQLKHQASALRIAPNASKNSQARCSW